MEIAAKQNAMATSWSPQDLVECIATYVSSELGQPVHTTSMYAMDSELSSPDHRPAGVDKGKRQLHKALLRANFKLITSPSKGAGRRQHQQQGGRGRGRGGRGRGRSSRSYSQQMPQQVPIVPYATGRTACSFAHQKQLLCVGLTMGRCGRVSVLTLKTFVRSFARSLVRASTH